MKKEKSKVVSMKLEFGSVRQEVANGAFFYRYQLKGQRKEVPLQTSNKEEALRKAKELIPLTRAQTVELVAAHVNQARGLGRQWRDDKGKRCFLADTMEKC